MAPDGECPNSATLVAYAAAKLGSVQAEALDRHLRSCRACFDQYLGLDQRPLMHEIPACHILKELGRGRFGVVYKAWWHKDEPKVVAVKVLNSSGVMEQTRFEREIAVLRRIQSPWVVKCLDSGATGESKYYLMDYVEGVHLDQFLAASGLDLSGKLGVFQRVCRAVADAHAQGVIHRDLKPRNILVDREGHPHILDFGICSVDPADWSSWARGTITLPGDVIGTLKYMSPEQAWGGVAGPINERTDLWALGIMLHEIVTDGGYPYALGAEPDKPAPEALLERIRKELPRLPRLRNLPRGRELEVLLERCLAWEPRQRFATVGDLVDDIERYGAGQKIRAKPLSPIYRLKRIAVGAATRSRGAFHLAFMAMLALILGGTAFLFNVGWRAPATPHGATAGFTDSASARERTVIAGIGDDTIGQVVAFAAERGMEGVTADVTTWRGVHGDWMGRLVAAKPRLVVWDYFFRSSQPHDERLAAGVNGLESAGIPVVLAAFSHTDDGRPDLSRELLARLSHPPRHGTIVARDMVMRPGDFVIALQRGGERIIPGLTLTAVASILHPEARVEVDWALESQEISLAYERGPGAYLRERDQFELTKAFTCETNQGGARKGDILGCRTLGLADPKDWERRTTPYESLLTASQEELHGLVGDRLVIVGDLRTTRSGGPTDRHPVRYGTVVVEQVPGCYLLADGITGLLDGSVMRRVYTLPPATYALMMLLSFGGCLAPIKVATLRLFEERRRRHALAGLLATLAIAAWFGMVMSKSQPVVYAGMAGLSLLTTMGGSFWVEFARNRHRVLDRGTRDAMSFDLALDGTLTLASKRGKLHPPTE